MSIQLFSPVFSVERETDDVDPSKAHTRATVLSFGALPRKVGARNHRRMRAQEVENHFLDRLERSHLSKIMSLTVHYELDRTRQART
jgi:hypothetical protein